MARMEHKMPDWKKELNDLQKSAKTPEEAAATQAFAAAIGPYLDKPELLRTLLGKIQRYLGADEVNVVGPNFSAPGFSAKSVDDLKKQLPHDVEVHRVE